ncbi:50S ribosomal protein L32 [Saprospira sp. CCB-QB6]|uniref:Large ribosomal subunit protein bL32 n=2 Tax=Saprospira grandis TaxID=1008 RepID=H6L9G6_SAPGL|nr:MULTISPECIES: 50S ribosomal protein L32 [Saprospira]AFC25442.1 50S ribosomal protein L32P [Saprospira grandis str. Lewin]EJF53821.1 ribosomal protein L32 [Saprospira grandis DSM 2844]WCL80381.1 50S ribosomal protein L32 [Saprospira sp. CCB-QB6]
MAHPKSRISKQRKRKRRTHYKIEAPNVIDCQNCGAPKLPHHVCGECGFYRGRLMVAPKVKEVAAPAVDFGNEGLDD